MPILDENRADALIQLACQRFDPRITEAEVRILRVAAGSIDPPKPAKDAPRPSIRPEFLRWLATDKDAARQIDPRGLRVYGHTIPGSLNLRNCHIAVVLVFHSCTFEGGVNLLSAQAQGIYLLDSSVESGIAADGARVDGPLFLKGSTFAGTIRLPGAKIAGILNCSGAKLRVAEGTDALNAENAEIGGSVFFHEQFESTGTIRLLGAKIAGQLNCRGAKLRVAEGTDALSADNAEIGGSVFLHKQFESTGTIRLHGAKIAGQLNFREATVAAVIAENLELSGDLFWINVEVTEKTFLNLLGAKVKCLCDDRESWPEAGNLGLDGFVYENLALYKRQTAEEIKEDAGLDEEPYKAGERIEWLKRQSHDQQIKPQPWMQLAKLLEAKGERKDAKHLIYKYRCLRAAQKEFWLSRRWFIFFAWLEEAPLRILYTITASVLLGALIFAGGSRSGAMIAFSNGHVNEGKPGEAAPAHYPTFQPLVYSLENCLPLVKLGMDDKWSPDPDHQPQPFVQNVDWLKWTAFFNWYWFLVVSRWFLILTGWIQATVFIAAVADRFKK